MMVTSFGQDALAEIRCVRPDQDTGIILSRFPEPGTPNAADEILERTGSTRYHSFWTGVTREEDGRCCSARTAPRPTIRRT